MRSRPSALRYSRLSSFALSLGILLASAWGRPVHYQLDVTVAELTGTVSGSSRITYHNTAADTLHSIWLHLYPNAFRNRTTSYAREKEKLGQFDFALAPARERGGLRIDSVWGSVKERAFNPDSTELELKLESPLAPGDSVELGISWTVKLPFPYAGLGRKGRNLILGKWYPQVAASDWSGWHTDGFHALGCSPAAFADYDVTITLTSDLPIAATGSGSRSQGSRGQGVKLKTVRFHAESVPDFALFAGPDFTTLQDSAAGTKLILWTRTPAEAWPLLRTGRNILNFYTNWLGPYPYPELTIVAGSGIVTTSISAPGLIILAEKPVPFVRLQERALAREIAKQWFAGMVAPDELRNPWLVHGLATFASARYLAACYGPDNLLEPALNSTFLRGLNDTYLHQVYSYLAAANHLTQPVLAPVTTFTDQFGFTATTQSQAALLLLGLEEQLGRAVIDSALRHYLRINQGAHPGPERLFACLTHAAGPKSEGLVTRWFESPTADYPLPNIRRITLEPIFSLPQFDTYQLFYGPWFWFDDYRGFQPGIWLQGRQFIDNGPMRGRHTWTLIENYSSKVARDRWHTGISYQTPITFISNRLRIFLAGDYSFRDMGLKAYLSQDLGRAFGLPATNIDLGYRLYQLKDTSGRDPRAWDQSRTDEIELRLLHSCQIPRLKTSVRVRLGQGLDHWSGFSYRRASLEQLHTITIGPRPALFLRGFGGALLGNVPDREQFYLSGGLMYNAAEPVSWGYQGIASGQEHWHYDADANCRGYAGAYRHGKLAYGLNIYLIPLKYLQPFFDIGNVADAPSGLWPPRLDAGVRIRIGPLYADFPFWKSRPEPGESFFAFRWLLGLKLAEISAGL